MASKAYTSPDGKWTEPSLESFEPKEPLDGMDSDEKDAMWKARTSERLRLAFKSIVGKAPTNLGDVLTAPTLMQAERAVQKAYPLIRLSNSEMGKIRMELMKAGVGTAQMGLQPPETPRLPNFSQAEESVLRDILRDVLKRFSAFNISPSTLDGLLGHMVSVTAHTGFNPAAIAAVFGQDPGRFGLSHEDVDQVVNSITSELSRVSKATRLSARRDENWSLPARIHAIETAPIHERAQGYRSLYESSGDPNIGSLARFYGVRNPDSTAIDDALTRLGYKDWVAQGAPGYVTKDTHPGMGEAMDAIRGSRPASGVVLDAHRLLDEGERHGEDSGHSVDAETGLTLPGSPAALPTRRGAPIVEKGSEE